MRKLLGRSARSLLWVLGIVFGLLFVAWAFHSPIVRWAVKKYSPEYTGRQITLERFHLNPLNGKVTMGGLKIMEAAGDSIFLHVDHLMVNTTLYKMMAGTYEISELLVHHPVVRITQRGDRFNFSDLIDRFASDTATEETTTSEPVRYALYDMLVDSVNLSYNSDLLPAPLRFVDASVACPQVKWDVPLIDLVLKALGANGMELVTEIGFDLEHMMYTAHVDAAMLPCSEAAPFVQPYFHISSIEGTLRADLFLRGSADDPMAFAMKGRMNVDSFSLNDPNGVRLVGLGHMDLVIDTVDVKQDIYRVRRFVLDEPYLFTELYDDGDNFTKWMPPDDSTDADADEEALDYDPENPFSMLAHYVKLVAEDYSSMQYKLDSLGVVNGTFIFNDFTLEQPFHYTLTDLSLTADDINSKSREIVLRSHAVLNADGTFDGELTLDPSTLRNMRFHYIAEGVGMPAFGPYTIHYVAHPILSGRTRYDCTTTIVDNKIKSENHILVEGFNFGTKMDVMDAYNLPMRLAVSLMKDKNGNIDLRIPVEGDLDDPTYKVWPILWQVLRNLLIKAVTAPGAALARTFDADEDDLRAVHFLFLQEELTGKQEKPLNILARVAREKPDLRIALVQAGDRTAEAEAYAIRNAKMAFFTDSADTAIDTAKQDLEKILADINIKSPGFIAWIDGKLGAGDEPVQKKCMRFVGSTTADAEVTRIWQVREETVRAYLALNKELPASAITVRSRVETDTLPTMGTPSFHMVYSASEGNTATSEAPAD